MSSPRHLSIRHKLLLAFGVITLLAGVAGFIAVAINAKIKIDIAQIRQAAIEKAEAVSEMAESLLELKVCCQKLVTENHEAETSAKSSHLAEIAEEITRHTKRFEAALFLGRALAAQSIEWARYEGSADEIRHAVNDLVLVDDIRPRFDQFKKAIQSQQEASTVDSNKEDGEFVRVSNQVEKYEADTKKDLTEEVTGIGAALGRANTILLSFAVIIVALGSFLTWFISRAVSQPIGVLKAFAQRIGQGNLEAMIDLKSRDEFGLLAATFNQMTIDLRTKTVSKDYVDSILKSMANSLIVLHLDHTITSINQATSELLGYPSSELVGQSMNRILQPSPSRAQSLLDEAFEKGSVGNVDVIYLSKAEAAIPMTFSASALRDSAGILSGLVCVALDISERKRAERNLELANRQLLDTSRRAGMAEVATSVLHNVGNVLNSVNVSSALISEKVQNSQTANFSKAVGIMEAHQGNLPDFFANDEKGRMLPSYLSKLAVNLEHEQREILKEVASLAGNILHIKEIVATQQNYARVSGIAERLRVEDLMDDALRINAGAMDRHGVEVVREYAKAPVILVEKHKLLQVLVNLISNAKYACEASGRKDKKVTLCISNRNDRIKIAVIDNGVGIPEENLVRVFGYGFTTKKDGHGFGLHSSSLTAKEMGGTLTVHSEGQGMGATFTLELPIRLDNGDEN